MANEDANKEVLLMRAKRLQQYCDLLIQQCDNWNTAPEYKYKYKYKNKYKNKFFSYLKHLIGCIFRKKLKD